MLIYLTVRGPAERMENDALVLPSDRPGLGAGLTRQ